MLKNNNGNIALFFALAAPLLLGFAGAGVDYARYRALAAEIQDIADAAALAGAREYIIASENATIPKAVALEIASSAIALTSVAGSSKINADSNDIDTTVTVAIAVSFEPGFLVGIFKRPLHMSVDATAQAVGGSNVCMIGLDDGSGGVVKIQQNATVTGKECAIFSNSTSNNGLSVIQNGYLDSALNCTAGGYAGSPSANFNPAPLTDCPPREDPLSLRPAPTAGACSAVPSNIVDVSKTLTPGVYCGGLTLRGAADVRLEPGVYVFRDGDLDVRDSAKLVGDGVGFYFEGSKSSLNFAADTTISLSAPETGEMAGLLMFQDRTAKKAKFTIASNNAQTLVGTIYLPNGDFVADAKAPIAGDSAYTAIIAHRIDVKQAVNLILNTDYDATSVPVPAGIASTGGNVRLSD